MQTRNKIGFHAGPSGNLTGIGRWMRQLDAAGIPFFLKSADHYGVLFEAARIAAQSGVPHTLIYRMSSRGQNDGYDYDVPPYEKTPAEAARLHWQRTRDKLPPEFDKERVWVEPINEVDKNRADWLGQFAVLLANLARADGYKVTLFGWSSGEPEREHWETAGMLAYLRLCAKRPEQAAVALHEYNFGLEPFEKVYPWHIGRFQILFDVCDKHKIARPTVHITEWGWSLNDVPAWAEALDYIDKANKLYGRFPNVKGAAIWNLGKGAEFGDVHNKAQRLIAPLLAYALQKKFTVPDVPDGAPPPIDPILRQEEENAPPPPKPKPPPDPAPVTPKPGVLFLADVTIPDDSPIEAGAAFRKTWRVENSGNVPWDATYRLVYWGGKPMTAQTSHPVPPANPGEQVDISLDLTAPLQPGVHFSDWRLVDGAGRPFGDILFTRILVRPPTGRNNARFVADVTIPDDALVAAGTRFNKTWRVENNGDRHWGAGYQLVFVNGHPMGHRLAWPLPAAAPGQQVEITIPFTAPRRRGTWFSDWRFQDAQGHLFGDIIYARVQVI